MLGVIGGSGLYALDGLEIIKEHDIETSFGKPSAPIIEGKYSGQNILFLARHGKGHQYLPHEVNYRANIFALKKLGARRLFGVSAAGSLREEIKPGDLAIASQYFDHTRGKRNATFFGNGIAAHVSTAYPVCPSLSADIQAAAKRIEQDIHSEKAYGCVEGPRLGTQVESFFLRDQAKCDLVGMTNVPEAFLAREAQLAYCTVCLVTDYDCWMEDPNQHVSVEKFFEVYGSALEKAKNLLSELLKEPFTETPESIRHSLQMSILTPDEALTEEQKEWLNILRA
ncbi:MAG: 5'-methylthioadenosine phosphorylase [Cocleimonas sp.]|jgi:5'-methylthioadenosine phosphorylase